MLKLHEAWTFSASVCRIASKFVVERARMSSAFSTPPFSTNWASVAPKCLVAEAVGVFEKGLELKLLKAEICGDWMAGFVMLEVEDFAARSFRCDC